MGVSESQPRSKSILRRLRLSTTTTEWPWSLRYREVGQPQKPSPPSTRIFLGVALTPFTSACSCVCGRSARRLDGRLEKADALDSQLRTTRATFSIVDRQAGRQAGRQRGATVCTGQSRETNAMVNDSCDGAPCCDRPRQPPSFIAYRRYLPPSIESPDGYACAVTRKSSPARAHYLFGTPGRRKS
jgi:hypothetical protein